MAAALAEQVKTIYHLAVSPDYVERAMASRPAISIAELYKKAIMENIKDVSDASVLPFGIGSQASATIPNDVVLQIHTSRDATQPLRICADATEEEAAMSAALQKSNNRRLLKLVLTDGYTEIPAFELTTLSVFKGVPIPGEKLLIRSGTNVRNGAIIMTDACVVALGGEVTQLKTEFLAHRRRMEAGVHMTGGLEGAPKFQPIDALASGAAFADRGQAGRALQPSEAAAGRGGGGGAHRGEGRGGGGGGGQRGRGRGGEGGRGGGRGGERGGDGRGGRGQHHNQHHDPALNQHQSHSPHQTPPNYHYGQTATPAPGHAPWQWQGQTQGYNPVFPQNQYQDQGYHQSQPRSQAYNQGYNQIVPQPQVYNQGYNQNQSQTQAQNRFYGQYPSQGQGQSYDSIQGQGNGAGYARGGGYQNQGADRGGYRGERGGSGDRGRGRWGQQEQR